MSKRKRRMFVTIGVILSFIIVAYAVLFKIPLKHVYTVDMLNSLENVIIVKTRTGPPTDWRIVGDKNGLFGSSEQEIDVLLVGNVPPSGYSANFDISTSVYVCFVKYTGVQPFSDLGEYKQYNVIDWVPFYPIERGLPEWICSKDYTCFWDRLF